MAEALATDGSRIPCTIGAVVELTASAGPIATVMAGLFPFDALG